jgi:hypothetical protein
LFKLRQKSPAKQDLTEAKMSEHVLVSIGPGIGSNVALNLVSPMHPTHDPDLWRQYFGIPWSEETAVRVSVGLNDDGIVTLHVPNDSLSSVVLFRGSTREPSIGSRALDIEDPLQTSVYKTPKINDLRKHLQSLNENDSADPPHFTKWSTNRAPGEISEHESENTKIRSKRGSSLDRPSGSRCVKEESVGQAQIIADLLVKLDRSYPLNVMPGEKATMEPGDFFEIGKLNVRV